MEFIDKLVTDDYVRRPWFDLLIGGETVTEVNRRLLSLTVTDNRGFEADTVELVIDDADGKLPCRGGVLMSRSPSGGRANRWCIRVSSPSMKSAIAGRRIG